MYVFFVISSVFQGKVFDDPRKCTTSDRLLIVESDAGHQNMDLISCARYRVIDERSKSSTKGTTHVLFLVQLPRVSGGTSFVSFQGGPWISAHIDDLHGSQNLSDALQCVLSKPIGDFCQYLLTNSKKTPEFDLCHRLQCSIHRVVAKLVSERTRTRAGQLIELLLNLIPAKMPDCRGK